MSRPHVWFACWWRLGAFCLAALLAAAAISNPADARSRRHHRAAAQTESYQPDYASIVVDANTGAVMQETNADKPRHPASLTKIMTLYLLFEQLEAGKIKLTTEMPVSAHAAAQAPSKLGLKPGETIDVETAIRSIVTKSANDVAVIIAEALGGSEAEFAQQMTAKARALGMMHTTYRNASGLPDDQQITTAHDMAILGRAINDRFPQYFRYFALRTFTYDGRTVRNHNHLLGTVDGVDGIKTGYIHDSGFNIVISVRRNNRHIVAVVFGGHTAAARDARMRSLIANNINIASAKRAAPPIVEGWTVAHTRKEAAPKSAAATPLPTTAPPMAGSTDPIRPNPVKTVAVQPASMRNTQLSPLPSASRTMMPAPDTANSAAITTVAAVKSEPVMPADMHAQAFDVASTGASVPVPAPAPDTKTDKNAKAHGDWMIQVGAFDSKTEAEERLTTVGSSSAKSLLGEARPYTERIEKGDKAMYRARFAGLEKNQAKTICRNLKRSDIPCVPLRN
jgi:D-alanyl-D-alanine carboxypeptidase